MNRSCDTCCRGKDVARALRVVSVEIKTEENHIRITAKA